MLVYSLNAECPEEISDISDRYEHLLAPFERIREDHTLLVKRFHRRSPRTIEEIELELERRLTYWAPIPARVDGFGAFVDPPGGVGPVIYLTVKSPGLIELHRELVDIFGTVVETIEGDHYVPHVTVARGGERTAIRPLTEKSIESVDWLIDELVLWDARYDQPVRRYTLG